MREPDDLTGWLSAWRKGDQAAEGRLMEAVYEDLRGIARRRLRAERHDHSLAPTAVVHEAYLRLATLRRLQWQNRTQFFAIAARVMRRILVDHARAHGAGKRGGGELRVPLPDHLGATRPAELELLDLDAALARLAAVYPRRAHVVELRFFGGLTVEEAAEVLGRSPAAIKRDWAVARAWLFRDLRGGQQSRPSPGAPQRAQGQTTAGDPAEG